LTVSRVSSGVALCSTSPSAGRNSGREI
jgi:hypothetical protein